MKYPEEYYDRLCEHDIMPSDGSMLINREPDGSFAFGDSDYQ